MKTDLFTKCVLTVIMLCLLWISIQIVPVASAEKQIQSVNIEQVGGVAVKCSALPVEIKGK